MCGGTCSCRAGRTCDTGLSPRVRGNRCRRGCYKRGRGSIPACAGEPESPRPPWKTGRVYPRVCGGTGRLQDSPGVRRGLSPRVRGNLGVAVVGPGLARSIPACAGEPRSAISGSLILWVYPRVCGGTRDFFQVVFLVGGLSPRVRGNQNAVENAPFGERSIPACAGEPFTDSGGVTYLTVYPRVCGGTGLILHAGVGETGLSPRVRGNPQLAEERNKTNRSIPACAGEPPRAAGSCMPVTGLSPRVRGNPTA